MKKIKLSTVFIIFVISFFFPFGKLYAINGILSVSLSADTPKTSIIIGNIYYPFTKISLVASSKDITISKIEVTRTGLGSDFAFKSISLVDADNNCSFGTTKKLVNGKATFNETIIIREGQTRNIYLAGNMIYSLAGHVEEMPALSLTSITVDSQSEITGGLPITGKTQIFNSVIIQNPGEEYIYGYEFNSPSQCPVEIAPLPTSRLSKITNDPLVAYQEYLESTNIEDVWSLTTGNQDIIVAIIDDGIYINHPDLRDNIWNNTNEVIGNEIDDDKNGYIDDIYGWDFISDEGEMTTRGTHGTMVGGIVGAAGNNNIGVTGINWKVRLMPLIVCGSDGCDTDAIIKAIKYATDNGADIINLSLGTQMTTGYSTKFDESIKYAFDKGVLIVAAAGNGDVEGGIGQDLNLIPQSPVCNDVGRNMVIGVGAIDPTYNTRTPWSNFGSNCVDVYAPGTGVHYKIVSTSVPAYSSIEGFYDAAEGTSFSAPIVSGIAALIKAKYPEISNTALRSRIINSTKSNLIVDAYGAIKNPLQENEKNMKNIDIGLSNRLKGKLLLQVEDRGRIWYVDFEGKRHEVTFANALSLFEKLALGISNADLNKITENDDNWPSSMGNRLKGKLLLQVEDRGRIWYVDFEGKRWEVTWANLMTLFESLALGITNNDLSKIPQGSL